MSFSGKVRHFMKEQRRYSDHIREAAERYRVPQAVIRADSLWCRLRYGASLANYISFAFYRLNGRERDQFMTDARTGKIIRLMNTSSPEEKAAIGNKTSFNRAYAPFVRRRWAFAPTCSDEELEELLRSHEELIAKPVDQQGGAGVRKIRCAEALADLGAFAAAAREEKLLLEEVVRQHPDMSRINPSSLNTLRISTVRSPSGQVAVVGASLRGGKAGSVVDNLHAGGVQYPVDLESGIISRGGVTFSGESGILFHPGSGLQMIGFRVPNWDKVIETVKAAAAIPPHHRYVGWDVAVTEDGCELIEANQEQGCNGMQLDGIGKYRIIRRYV